MATSNPPSRFHEYAAGVHASTQLSSERAALVDRARESWVDRLVDRSRRNMLLYYRPLKIGTLDLSSADPEVYAGLLNGETVTLARLLPDADQVRVSANALEIRRRAQANEEEKGIETLFLAMGLASWPAADSGRPPEAPVLLLPVAIEVRGREGTAFTLRRNGDVQANLVLLQALEAEFGLGIAPDPLVNGSGVEEETFDPAAAFEHLRSQAQAVRGFTVSEGAAVLGNFSFQKMAMVRDLLECGAELIANDLVAALAGDAAARTVLLAERSDVDPHSLDDTPPDNEFLVLDADSSQQRVVACVLRNQDGVIHGPPGTGKSQTIVNLIAELAAQGRRSLFVAEKRAALDVVLRRLRDVGLDHLALDLHGADISRRDVYKRIGASLDLVRDTPVVDSHELHVRFTERRARLNDHVRRMHQPHGAAGLSVFDMQGRLLRIPEAARSTVRWRRQSLQALGSDATREIDELLKEAAGFDTLLLRTAPSRWAGSVIPDGDTADRAIELATRLAAEHWPAFLKDVSRLAATAGLREPSSLDDARATVTLLTDVQQTLKVYDDALFQKDLGALAEALRPGLNGGIGALWAWATNSQYRAARSTLRALRRPGQDRVAVARDMQAAADQARRWRERTDQADAFPSALGESVIAMHDHLEAVVADIDALLPILGLPALGDRSLEVLDELVTALAGDSLTPRRLPRLFEIEKRLGALGLDRFLADLRKTGRASSLWPQAFEHAWLSSYLEAAQADDPSLAGFNGRTHEQFVEEFRRLDRQRLVVAVERVRRTHAERVIAAMNDYPDQAALVRREAAKRARHLPLRKLLAAAPDVLTALFPCWMASPLAVSQLIGSDRRYFDVVLFDEASQVLPEDAVAALLRGTRAVVAGDRHQLPPTSFFAGGEDEDQDGGDDAGATAGFESLLDLMSAFATPWPLDWHYRSRDERLIAFANHHVYDDRLVTFPSAYEESALQHVLARALVEMDGQEDSPSPEVEQVVDLILDHATKRPGESLGVITLGIKHASRVQAALDRAKLLRPDLDAFFDEKLAERFFVKNLERVQGDERDAILLTVGVGMLRGGRVDYRGFGPLNGDGGRRRLNVAITRARRRMTVVSSFTHLDMDPNRSHGGTGLLRDYLQYAVSGGRIFGDGRASTVPLNAFEADIKDALEAAGIPIVPQWGASKYRIDLVARHPEREGQFVMAIECDGATYHSAPTARDRDRLRQQHLEALGWSFHRIWSTDWFQHRDQEIARAVQAYQRAVAAADREQRSATVSSTTPSTAVASTNGVSAQVAAGAAQRGTRPALTPRLAIDAYSSGDLLALAHWVQSDGRLRTDDQIFEEMVQILGYLRRGQRIIDRLNEIIRASHKLAS